MKKIIWPLIILMSISLTIIFTIGFITSVDISKDDKTDSLKKNQEQEKTPILNEELEEKENIKLTDTKRILALGDSLAFGIGDEGNLGFLKRYEGLLKKEKNQEVESINLSIPGYKSDQLLQLLISQENNEEIKAADIIIISIGGNDIKNIEYTDEISTEIVYREALKKYKVNLESSIKEIRKLNPNTQLAIVGLYDPYKKEEPEKTRFLLEWNFETRLIVNNDFKMVYIPTYEKFEYHLKEYLSEDNFHPNGQGYQIIAEELFAILYQ